MYMRPHRFGCSYGMAQAAAREDRRPLGENITLDCHPHGLRSLRIGNYPFRLCKSVQHVVAE